MIILDCEQGSWAWRKARLGIPTTSQFERMVTPAKLKPGKAADTYMAELLAEWVSGKEQDEWVSPWAERGTRLEPEARRFLRFELGAEIREVGFVYRDEKRLIGCSPDGLVYRDGEVVAGAEIKCPALKTHIGYLLKPETLVEDYKMQIQGGLWVTGLPRWYACSYYPGMPPVIVEVEPDRDVFTALDMHMPAFVKGMVAQRKKLLDMGVEPKLPEDPDSVPEWALPSVDVLPLDDAELEAFEAARRDALSAGEITQAEHDALVQQAVNGDFAEIRRWLRGRRAVTGSAA